MGILLGFLAYALYSMTDALVKGVGTGISVFEIGFFLTLFSGIPLFFAKPKDESWHDLFKASYIWKILIRAFAGVLGGLFSFYAFTRLPLAEVYALIFLMPMMVTVFSALILKEPVGWRRITLIFTGFLGVILVIRPGFRELQLAHLAAGLAPIAGAITVIVLRQIVREERRTSLIGITYLFSLVVNGVLMLAVGYQQPDMAMMIKLVLAGLLVGFAGLAILHATRLTQANLVAPTQYSQIGWAVLLGSLFYQEYPDFWTFMGLIVIGISGFLTFLREEIRFGWLSKMTFLIRSRT